MFSGLSALPSRLWPTTTALGLSLSQGAGAVSVGVAQLDRAQLFSFQFDQAVSQWFRSHVLARDLAGKAHAPGFVEPRTVLGVHPCPDARCGHDSGGVQSARAAQDAGAAVLGAGFSKP
jgi:hypothetical protein